MPVYQPETSAEIPMRWLMTTQRSDIQWVVLARKDSTIEEARNYAYGNTIVFPAYGNEHIFLAAITKGTYVEYQEGRYQSGLWWFERVEGPDEADEFVLDWIGRFVNG